MVRMLTTSRSPVTTYRPAGTGKSGDSIIRPCSSSHQSLPSNCHFAGASPPAAFNCSKLSSHTPRGPGSRRHYPHECALFPEPAFGSPSAAMNCGEIRLNSFRFMMSDKTGCPIMYTVINKPMTSIVGLDESRATVASRHKLCC